MVAHLAHTWLLRGHITKTTCTIDFKLHMAIKQLSNTTHTKKEEERSNPTGAMNSFQIQTKKHYFSLTTKLHWLIFGFSTKLQKGLLISILLLDLTQKLKYSLLGSQKVKKIQQILL